MIIRISKFETVVFSILIITVSFLFALNFEKKSATASTTPNTVQLPILMYHHITENEKNAGKYTVLKNEFEEDLKYIENNGYTTISVAELCAFVNGEGALPEKPIMITFDDGFESFYTIAYPLLKNYNMKAVVSVIGNITEKYSAINDHNVNYSNLTWDEINELHQSGLIEIQNHSYDMHKSDAKNRKGISKLKNETTDEYKKALTADLKKLQELFSKNCGFTPTALVYPFGAHSSKKTIDIVKSCGFICTLGCEEKINKIVQSDPECLFNLGRFNRESGIKSETFFENIK